jgi:ribosomal-protein-alanine N-acetyltransferase
MNLDSLFSDQPILETERLVLRRLNIYDAAEYHALASDPLVTTHLKKGHHTGMDETLRFLESVQTKFTSRRAYNWGIVEKENEMVIGRVNLFGFDPDNESGEMGFVISRAHWNKGISTEAASKVLDYSFRVIKLKRVIARCNEENIGSERVLQKVGMKYEGLLREHLKINGKLINQKQYAIAKQSFELNEKEPSDV